MERKVIQIRPLQQNPQKLLLQQLNDLLTQGDTHRMIEKVLRLSEQLSSVEQSVFLLRQAIRHAPREVALHEQLIRMFLRSEQFEQAHFWWKLALKITPHCGSLWAVGVRVALAMNDGKTALSCLHHALTLLEDEARLKMLEAQVCFWQAEQALQKNEPERGLLLLRRAATLQPQWDEPHERLAEELSTMGHKRSAQRYKLRLVD